MEISRIAGLRCIEGRLYEISKFWFSYDWQHTGVFVDCYTPCATWIGYYKLSIYHGYIWYDSAHSITTTMKWQSEIAYLPKFSKMMTNLLIIMISMSIIKKIQNNYNDMTITMTHLWKYALLWAAITVVNRNYGGIVLSRAVTSSLMT